MFPFIWFKKFKQWFSALFGFTEPVQKQNILSISIIILSFAACNFFSVWLYPKYYIIRLLMYHLAMSKWLKKFAPPIACSETLPDLSIHLIHPHSKDVITNNLNQFSYSGLLLPNWVFGWIINQVKILLLYVKFDFHNISNKTNFTTPTEGQLETDKNLYFLYLWSSDFSKSYLNIINFIRNTFWKADTVVKR